MHYEVMVSIIVPTYGHEKYISQALDSILMQKTEYTYEVLVGEDASPDGTKEILQKYEKNYPNVFRMFYREYNMSHNRDQNGNKIGNSHDLKLRSRGKYIIVLEGDDYWISPNKLQKEVDFLEQHKDYIAVAHNCVVVDRESKPNGERYQECKDNEYTLEHFMYHIFPGQLTTVMYRNFWKDENLDCSILVKGLSPGDQLLYFFLVVNGKIWCIQETLSAYRHVIKGGNSYSATTKYNFEKTERWNLALMEYAYSIGNLEAIFCTETLYFSEILLGYRKKKITLKQFFQYLKRMRHHIKPLYLYSKRIINRHVLHKEQQ